MLLLEVSIIYLDEKALLLPDVRGELTNSFELIR